MKNRLSLILIVVGAFIAIAAMSWWRLDPWVMGKDSPAWVKPLPAVLVGIGASTLVVGIWIRMLPTKNFGPR